MTRFVTSAEVNLSSIAHNVRELRRLTDRNARMMAVVKADGYGHGSAAVAKTALENGAAEMAVARFNEAEVIRAAGLDAPLLLFGYTPPELTEQMLGLNLRPSINSLELAQELSDRATKAGGRLKAHIKIDTGMGRMGFDGISPSPSTIQNILDIASLPGLEIDGIYTHFANADSSDKDHAKGQFRLFSQLLCKLRKSGLEIPTCHSANSAAIIEMPQTHLDMVRPGISLYGFYPSDEVEKSLIDLKPAMTLKSTVIQVKDVPAGFKVSYGSTHVTQQPTRIATVPIGYADGYSRLLSSQGQMLVHGQRAPIIGRVCMDLTMIDVSHIEGVESGDEVVVFGSQNGHELHADELAATTKTINYEIVSAITARVPRIYI